LHRLWGFGDPLGEHILEMKIPPKVKQAIADPRCIQMCIAARNGPGALSPKGDIVQNAENSDSIGKCIRDCASTKGLTDVAKDVVARTEKNAEAKKNA